MAMVGHRTESIYRRYAIADEAMLKEGAIKLAAFHASEKAASLKVVPRKKMDKGAQTSDIVVAQRTGMSVALLELGSARSSSDGSGRRSGGLHSLTPT
jgi:hypothetical protein